MTTTSTPKDDEQDELCCAICLEPKPLVVAKCSHRACIDCFERIILPTSSTSSVNYDDGGADDDDGGENNNNNGNNNHENNREDESLEDRIITACPTRGRCPFCRCCINLFDLVQYNQQPQQHETETETKTETENQTTNITSSSTSSSSLLLFEPNINLKDTPLHNLEYIDGNSDSRIISFKDGIPVMILYKNFEDRKELLKRQFFDSGYRYHAKRHLFEGIIHWTEVRFLLFVYIFVYILVDHHLSLYKFVSIFYIF